VNVWLDIDNEPQARYLLPLARAFQRRGHHVLLTARDQGETLRILREEEATFHVVGESFGRGLPRKLRGLLVRARELRRLLEQQAQHVDVVLTGSRSAALVARQQHIPSFVIIDYEHVNLLIYRLAASQIFHPDVIGPANFQRHGIRRDRLLPFRGIKEDLSFSALDLEATPPYDLGNDNGSIMRVLFRPPAEDSHYYRSESRKLALALLRHLAEEDVQIVLSPRESAQAAYLDEVRHWRHEPLVLQQAVPFVSLLKSVDAVVSAGGTMLREAAYLGVPAYSILRSRIGAVDRHLASVGRLSILTSPSDFARLAIRPKGPLSPLRKDSSVVEEIAAKIEERTSRGAPA
jgi:predicted glycosyltransferase